MPGAKPYTLRWVLQHPLARMLPLGRYQAQTYRLGERIPPSALEDHGPMWEAVEFLMDPLDTLQARVNLQRDFTLMAVAATCSSNVNGGFRLQFYDLKRRFRFADRPINFANVGGPISAPLGPGLTPSPIFLREPYRFAVPDSQILLDCQSFENVTNDVQILFYGQVMRFNAPGLTFPGGPITGWDWANSVQHYMQRRGGR
jgi:hypothetical protein